MSKTATCGRSGSAARASRISATAAALWSGATPPCSSSAAMTPSSISVGAVNRAPPNTTRWPTATRPGGASESAAIRLARPAPSTTSSFTPVDPALTESTAVVVWSAAGMG